jgi:hypothetical protein
MHHIIIAAPTGQARVLQPVPTSLDGLAAYIRDAHAGFVAAFSNAIDHAIDAGQALIVAKDRTPHGQWAKLLKHCDLGERQAERYMRLARLLEANPTSKSDLASLPIEAAIKKLSPPKLRKMARGRAPVTKTATAHTTEVDITAAWLRAPQEAIPDDLSIPEFLLREPPGAAGIAPRPAPLLVAPAPSALTDIKNPGATPQHSPGNNVDLVDQCVENVCGTVERAIDKMRRGHASQERFGHLFEALGDAIVDLARKTLSPTEDAAVSAEKRREAVGP